MALIRALLCRAFRLIGKLTAAVRIIDLFAFAAALLFIVLFVSVLSSLIIDSLVMVSIAVQIILELTYQTLLILDTIIDAVIGRILGTAVNASAAINSSASRNTSVFFFIKACSFLLFRTALVCLLFKKLCIRDSSHGTSLRS